MRQYLLVAPLLAAVVCGSGSASAQQVIETYPNDPYYEEYVQPVPRVYRYGSDAPVLLPVRPASCGEFRYWNGEHCVDARVIPPAVR